MYSLETKEAVWYVNGNQVIFPRDGNFQSWAPPLTVVADNGDIIPAKVDPVTNALVVKLDGSVVITAVAINNWIDLTMTLTDGVIHRDVNSLVDYMDEIDPLTGKTKRTTFTRNVDGRVTAWNEVIL